MKRIMIVGNGGAGKSTLAQKIGQVLTLPVHHLDSLFWQPGWVETEREVFIQKQQQILSNDRWVVDGNYSGTMDVRIASADTVILLDYSRWVCLWGVISRRIKYRNSTRPDVGEGCPERLDWAFLKWVFTYPEKGKARALKHFAELPEGTQLLQFRSRRETERWVEELQR